MSNRTTFQDLSKQLDMPFQNLAPLLRRSVDTLSRYASDEADALEPPNSVIVRMKALLRSKAFDDLEAAGATLDPVVSERSTPDNVEDIDVRYDPEDKDRGHSAARERIEEGEVREKPCVSPMLPDELSVRRRLLTLLAQRYAASTD
jgi:hypothetical protein